MAASVGSQAKMAWDSALPIDTSSKPVDFISHTLTATHSLIDTEGIRGTRSRSKERVRQGNIDVSGQIVLNPSPAELDFLLPCILGASESTDTFALAETLPEFWIMVDHIAKCHTFNGLKVSRATFSGSSGQPITLTLEVIGKSITEAASGSFPALTFDTDAMYVFSDAESGLTLQGTGSRKFDDFELVIDNVVNARFMNSRNATDIHATDRIITLSLSTPYTSDETDLYTDEVASAAGAAGTLVFTNGNQSLTFSLANLKATARNPNIAGRGEIVLPLSYRAYKSGSTNELVVTHDSAA